jgi:hypothetical protein
VRVLTPPYLQHIEAAARPEDIEVLQVIDPCSLE